LAAKDVLKSLPLEEFLELLSYFPEKAFRIQLAKDFLKGLPPEEILKLLPRAPEQVLPILLEKDFLKGVPPAEILKRLPREAIEDFLKRTQNGASSRRRQSGDQPR
jgi:hypothetical protein